MPCEWAPSALLGDPLRERPRSGGVLAAGGSGRRRSPVCQRWGDASTAPPDGAGRRAGGRNRHGFPDRARLRRACPRARARPRGRPAGLRLRRGRDAAAARGGGAEPGAVREVARWRACDGRAGVPLPRADRTHGGALRGRSRHARGDRLPRERRAAGRGGFLRPVRRRRAHPDPRADGDGPAGDARRPCGEQAADAAAAQGRGARAGCGSRLR